jgi:hypothetical protein
MVERLWKREHQFDGRRYFVERELILDWSETRSMTSPRDSIRNVMLARPLEQLGSSEADSAAVAR